MEYTKKYRYVDLQRSWYKHIASKINYLYRGIHNGIYVTYYQETNSFQYLLLSRYDNWCYSKHGRNKILLKGKRKDRLKKKLKIWSWKGTIKLKYRFDIQQLPSSFEERNVNKKFINHFRFYVKVLLCWKWNSIMFKEEIVS